MAMQTPVQLVSGGGGLAASGYKDVMCQAFREAMADHCSKPVGQRGSFNNKFFDKLKALDPKLAGNIQREVPIVFGGAAGEAGALASSMTNAPNPLGAVASCMNAAYQSGSRALTGGAADSVSGAVSNANIPGGPWAVLALAKFGGPVFGVLMKLTNLGIKVKFPDGLINNQIIEVKGPGDTFSKANAKQYQKFSKPDPPIVPSCESCGASCVNKKTSKGGC